MTERVFTAEEVNAALGWNWTSIPMPESEIVEWWRLGDDRMSVAALALGVLPEGVDECDGCGDGFEYQGIGWMAYRRGSAERPRIESDDWSGIVRSGQADIAGRLVAARVELDRLRAPRSPSGTRGSPSWSRCWRHWSRVWSA